jgi:hypothetical protein
MVVRSAVRLETGSEYLNLNSIEEEGNTGCINVERQSFKMYFS